MNTLKCSIAVFSFLMLTSYVSADDFEFTEIFIDQALDGLAPIVVPFDLGPLFPQATEQNPDPDPIWTPAGSVVGVAIEISHTYAGDVEFSMTSPDGQVFQFSGQSFNNGSLGVNGLGNSNDIAWYGFQAPGAFGLPPWGADPAQPTFNETNYIGDALSWGQGPFDPQGWTLEINDAFSLGDDGFVGEVSVVWQPAAAVPEPNLAMMLPLVLVGFGLRRRRHLS